MNTLNEELAKETMEQLIEDFQIFNNDFNNNRQIGFLLLSFILYLKPEMWNKPEISYEKFCVALDIVKNNKGIQEMLKVRKESEMRD